MGNLLKDFRIRKLGPKNIIFERRIKTEKQENYRKWELLGSYARIEDIAETLLNFLIEQDNNSNRNKTQNDTFRKYKSRK